MFSRVKLSSLLLSLRHVQYRTTVSSAPSTQWESQAQQMLNGRDLLKYWIDTKDTITVTPSLLTCLLSLIKYHSSRHPNDFPFEKLPELNRWVLENVAQLIDFNPALLRSIIQRYGQLNDIKSLRELLPLTVKYIHTLRSGAIVMILWFYAKNGLRDDELWGHHAGRLIMKHKWSVGELVYLTLSLTAIERRIPEEVLMLRKQYRHYMKTEAKRILQQNSEECINISSLALIGRNLLRLNPLDSSIGKQSLSLVYHKLECEKQVLDPFTISCLWGIACRVRLCDAYLIEMLCEATRGLRLSAHFSGHLAAEVASAIQTLGVNDPRVNFQLMQFVKTTKQIPHHQILKLMKSFSGLKITNETCWKQFATNFKQKGSFFSLEELRQIEKCFSWSQLNDNQLQSFIHEFERSSEDEMLYGNQDTVLART